MVPNNRHIIGRLLYTVQPVLLENIHFKVPDFVGVRCWPGMPSCSASYDEIGTGPQQSVQLGLHLKDGICK